MIRCLCAVVVGCVCHLPAWQALQQEGVTEAAIESVLAECDRDNDRWGPQRDALSKSPEGLLHDAMRCRRLLLLTLNDTMHSVLSAVSDAVQGCRGIASSFYRKGPA